MLDSLVANWPVTLATALPVLVYVIIGLMKRSKATSIDEYFIYSQQVSARDYANTSVGYALQMAAIFLFAYWGALYGLGALWTPIFWMIGFFLLYVLLPTFLPFHDEQPKTLHQYLAERFRGGRTLQVIASIATIFGLLGTMMAEIDFTIQIYSPVISNPTNLFLLGAFFLIFGVGYIVYNGYKAEVNTERLQVPLAYLGLIIVLLFTLPAVWRHSGPKAYWTTISLLTTAFVIIIIAKLRNYWRNPLLDWQVLIPIFALIVVWLQHGVIMSNPVGAFIPGTASSVLDTPFSTQMYAQGVFALFSLFVANVLWMPVDFSTWQRIASVEGRGSETLKRLRRGTFRVMLESPASWCLGVALGLIIQAGGFLPADKDPSEGIAQFSSALASGTATPYYPWMAGWLYPIFLVACISIMLSTVDSIISAIAFTAYNDLSLRRQGELPNNEETVEDQQNKKLQSARRWTILIALVGGASYPVLRYWIGATLPTVLYAAYSAQLSLFVIVLLALLNKKLEKRASLFSLCSGIVATAISFFLAVHINTPAASVLPPIFAVMGAMIGYIVAYDRKAAAETVKANNAEKE